MLEIFHLNLVFDSDLTTSLRSILFKILRISLSTMEWLILSSDGIILVGNIDASFILPWLDSCKHIFQFQWQATMFCDHRHPEPLIYEVILGWWHDKSNMHWLRAHGLFFGLRIECYARIYCRYLKYLAHSVYPSCDRGLLHSVLTYIMGILWLSK